MVKFPASYDRTTLIVTLLVAMLTLGIAFAIPIPVLFVLPLVLLSLAFAWSPRGYAITPDSLVIERWVGKVAIPLSSIQAARVAAGDDLKHVVRVFGSGGVFGYYGKFHTSGLGNSDWYATAMKKALVVRTTSQTLVLSPDDGDGFLAALAAAQPALNRSVEPQANFGKMPSPGYWKFIVAVFALVAILIGGLLVYSPGLPQVDVNATDLVIHDRFYGTTVKAADADLAGVRVVDLHAEPEMRPAERTNGFANSHYRSGHFKLKNGQSVLLYNAGASRVVWLPVKSGKPVMLETADPDAFIAQLKQTWGRR